MVGAQPDQLSPTHYERYGWRFWALRPDGVLVAPFASTEVASGTFDAGCGCGCSSPAAADCTCGVHYALSAAELVDYAQRAISVAEYPTLQRVRDQSWATVLTYGVAVCAVQVDRTKLVPPGRRARRWHMLALLSPRISPERQVLLGKGFGCDGIPDASYEACRAVSERLVSSVSPTRMTELASARQPQS
jgi:hypothetical protein